MATTATGITYTLREPGKSVLTMISSPASVSPGGQPAESFLKRLFHRRKSNGSTGERNPSANFESMDDGFAAFVTPSPVCHPLLSKPVPRDDVFRPRPRTADAAISSVPNKQPSVKTARRDVESQTLRYAEIHKRSLRERERAAMEAAVDTKYVPEWGFYFKCYAEGRFNLSNPPEPPPKKPEYDHFAAPATLDEQKRLKAVRACNGPLPRSTIDRLNRLVFLARKVFQTQMAAISLVEEDVELFKAEDSFARVYVNRWHSFGAHVLLANEPMVVLDAVKDWRLRGNPLTKRAPNLRFYSGAPIVTDEGHAIGVFAVFDTRPRSNFSSASRRILMDFARLAMTEFEIAVEERALLKQHTPSSVAGLKKVLERDKGSLYSRRGILSTKLLESIEEKAQNKQDVEQPPSEWRSDSPTVPLRRQSSFVTIGSSSVLDLETPIQKPRSVEYPAAIILMPPQTPSRPFAVPQAGREYAASLSPHPEPLTPAPPRRDGDYKRPRRATTVTRASNLNISVPRSPSLLTTSPSTTTAPGSIMSITEATFAISLIARSLDYDFVYLLRVASATNATSPSHRRRETTHTPTPTVTARILVAHGLPNPPPVFDANLHLHALRSLGGLIFQNPVTENSKEDNVGYQSGILLPLCRDSVDGIPLEGGDSGGVAWSNVGGGIVLAAFAQKAAANSYVPFRVEEVRFLTEFADAMRDILVRADPDRSAVAKKTKS